MITASEVSKKPGAVQALLYQTPVTGPVRSIIVDSPEVVMPNGAFLALGIPRSALSMGEMVRGRPT